MKLLWIAVVLLLVVGIGAVGVVLIGPGGATARTSDFLTAAVQRTNVVDQVVATGSLASAQTYGLAFGQPAQASVVSAENATATTSSSAASSDGTGASDWVVHELKVAAGQHVKKGTLLATADTTAVDAQIVAAQAQLDAAVTQLDTAPTSLALYNARAQVAQDTQSLAELKAARKFPTLTAPADGTVTSVNLVVGRSAPGGTAITITGDALVTTAQVAEADVARIASGQDADVTITALGASVAGKVTAVASSGSSASGGVVSFGVVVSLTKVPTGARPGMSTQVAITIAEADGVLAIPSAALKGSAGSYQARVMDANGQPQAQPITVGLITGNLIEVRSGLQAGDVVVTGTVSALSNQAQTGQGGLGGLGGFGGGFGGGGGGGRQARGN